MTILRLLVPTVAALALSATVSAAGPCTQQIGQVQAQIDAKLRANAAAGPTAPESAAALRSRQPTPGSIAEEESKLGVISQEWVSGSWISGFFGSGKSQFLKVLSYLLNQRTHTNNGQ